MEKLCECGLVEVNDCYCAEYESAAYGPLDDPPWEQVDDDEIDWGEVDEDTWDNEGGDGSRFDYDDPEKE